MGAVLARWRAGLSQGDAGEDGPGGPWLSRVLVGRAAAVLLWLCGVSSLVSLLWPSASGGQPSGASVAAAVAAGAGLLSWFLPWNRWPRWAGLFLVPVGFALVALQIALASPDARVYRRPLRPALRLDRRRVPARDGADGAAPVRGRVLAAPGLLGAALGTHRGLGGCTSAWPASWSASCWHGSRRDCSSSAWPVAVPRHGERHRRRARLRRGSGGALVVDRRCA